MKKKQTNKPEKLSSILHLRAEKKELEKQVKELQKKIKHIDKQIVTMKRIREKAVKESKAVKAKKK